MTIKTDTTSKVLSARSGLLIFDRLYRSLILGKLSYQCLEETEHSKSQEIKLKAMIMGFISGADSLSAMSMLSHDPLFTQVCQRVYSPQVYGDFLRGFKRINCKKMNYSLIDLAYRARQRLARKTKSITIDIDSTKNRQYAKKMEGAQVSYEGFTCLDTVYAFDELGFQYWADVREGTANTSRGAVEIIHSIFDRMPRTKDFKHTERYIRMDAGYCNGDVFQACLAKKAHFVICMRKNMYEPLIDQATHWHAVNHKKKNAILFSDGRPVELSEVLYRHKRCRPILRVILMRSRKKDASQYLYERDRYDYRAWITSIGNYQMKKEAVIQFYRKRGNAENFIREAKNGFDLKHYPCLKLLANKAYGLIAGFAFNLMRFFALKEKPAKPRFAKGIRNMFIFLPGQIVRHARKIVLRLNPLHKKEIDHWIQEFTFAKSGST